jgi:DNA polymerase-4
MSAPALCRDCLALLAAEPKPARCSGCGSPRMLSHPESDALAIAHVDCDAFFATIEKRDNPALRDKPVIIGGGRRGVVATACYVARTFGVHSAMPMFKALEACPHAVVIPPDINKYGEVGGQVRRLMRGLTPLVEPVSIDEAFLDLAGTERLHHASPARSLLRFAQRVEKEIGITVSIGLSYNKFLAKIASDLEKPRGFSVLGRREAAAFLQHRPVTLIPGIGGATQASLAKAGVTLIRHLREVPAETLLRIVGSDAQRLARLAAGHDDRPVTPERAAKSISAETTFAADLSGFDALEPILWHLCEKVARRLKRAGLAGRSITLKLKDSSFRLRTRSRSGLPPTQLARRLFAPARMLLRNECDGSAFRLIGVAASDLCDAGEADNGDLVDVGVARDAQIEAAVDRLRDRFGLDAVQKGLAFRSQR